MTEEESAKKWLETIMRQADLGDKYRKNKDKSPYLRPGDKNKRKLAHKFT